MTRTPFSEVFPKAYGWTVDDDGYLAGLVNGDMGYETTDMKLVDLFVEAQVNEDRRARPTKGPWPVYSATIEFINACYVSINEE